MLTFIEFLKEDVFTHSKGVDYDAGVQGFMNMDAQDARDQKINKEKHLVTLAEPDESLIREAHGADHVASTEYGADRWDPKYTKIRNAKQKRLEDVYGVSDKPLSNKEISAHAVNVAMEFDSLSPKDQKARLSLAKQRRTAAGLQSTHTAGNSKNETANDVPSAGRKNLTYGLSGSPEGYPHITSGGVKYVVTCPAATASCGGTGTKRGIGGTCLAQMAQGKQSIIRAARDHYSQAEHHNKDSLSDHVITLMHNIRLLNKQANSAENSSND